MGGIRMKELTEPEKAVLWACLNTAQHVGMINTASIIEKYRGTDVNYIDNWLKQSQEEYYLVESLKMKLLPDWFVGEEQTQNEKVD
jgi:ornithine carbamoyltransferase